MSTPTSTSFCVLPWMHVFADEGGAMYPCCRSVGTKKPNVDAQGRTYRIQDAGDLEAAWNSGYMRTLRRDMLEGRRPAPCSRCYMYDDLGMLSHRQEANGDYAPRIAELVEQTSPDGSVPLDPLSVDLRLGNLCNLRCRMCSPTSSRALLGEFAEAYKLAPTHRAFEHLRFMDWFASDTFWTIFERYTAHVERLHFAGGEPFLIPQMFAFLARLVALGRSSNIALSYNTNLTLLPEELYTLWPKFRSVRVTVSLDGYADVNTLIRFPSDWATTTRHLQRLEDDYERLNLRGGVSFNTTVQILNVLRVGELLEFLAEKARRAEVPNLSVLTHPRHLSIQALPASLKHEAANRLSQALHTIDGRWPEHWGARERDELHRSVAGVVEHMMEKDASAVLPELRRWTDIQDRARGLRAIDVLPELAPVLAVPA